MSNGATQAKEKTITIPTGAHSKGVISKISLDINSVNNFENKGTMDANTDRIGNDNTVTNRYSDQKRNNEDIV